MKRSNLIVDCASCGRPRCVERVKCHHCGTIYAAKSVQGLTLVSRSARAPRLRWETTEPRLVIPRLTQTHTAFVYLITDGNYCKIGMTKNLTQRLQMLQNATPYELRVVDVVETTQAEALESFLHGLFASKHHRNEWFTLITIEEWHKTVARARTLLVESNQTRLTEAV